MSSKFNINFNAGCGQVNNTLQEQPIRINNNVGQTVIVTVDPITNEFIITTEGNPSLVFKDSVSKVNTFTF
jgi:hypothetical protein